MMPTPVRGLRRAAFFLVAMLWLVAPTSTVAATEPANQLKDHPAPYLALHGDDPIHWRRWGPEVVAEARASNKVMYLSVGYYACHWCHVMQRESYQDEDIAAYVNRHFLPVKIDRELEPALDTRLMDFAQATTGRGGWPLNVFITPDGHPIYAVLYLPPAHFLETLNRMQTLWETDRERVLELVRQEAVTGFPDADPDLQPESVARLKDVSVGAILAMGDPFSGGFGQQNKFPSTPQLMLLVEEYRRSGASDVARFLTTTLDAMARGGLRDHLADGFFRYTVDPDWQVPHFEKMLYDNANLARLYIVSGEALGNPAYTEIGRRTLEFLESRMWHPDGALVASFSAVDDDGVEGGHYLWTTDQLESLLDDDQRALANALWDLDRPAELEAGNHLRYVVTPDEYASQHGLNAADVQRNMDRIAEILLAQRDRRSLPVDDILLAGWNGLALGAFARAARVLDDEGSAATARALRDFLMSRLWDGENLHRALARGELMGSASLEDYAYVADGLLQWARYTGKEDDYQQALVMVQSAWQRFHRDNGWFQEDGTLLAPASASELIADGANASPSAVLLATSVALARHFEDERLGKDVLSALNRGAETVARSPFWYATRLSALAQAMAADLL